MRLVMMLVEFLKKFLLLAPKEQLIINHMRADMGRKREFERREGFIPVQSANLQGARGFVYEPSMDLRLTKLRRTGPYFRIWFTVEKNGDIYFVDFVKLS